jgi:cytochrome-b5 reductase
MVSWESCFEAPTIVGSWSKDGIARFERRRMRKIKLTAGRFSPNRFLFFAFAAGKAVIRPYTPTSPVGQQGSFDLIVKAYPEGNISKWMTTLKEGDSVEMKGPLHKYKYEPNQWKAIGMIAGGTGITPMWQVINEILSNPRDKTEIRLIYANRTPEDILLKKELDALAAAHPNFKVLYTVDSVKDEKKWPGLIGHVNAEMIQTFLPPPETVAEGKEPSYKIMVCGPPGMYKAVSGEKKSPTDQGDLTGLLGQLKYAKAQVFKY